MSKYDIKYIFRRVLTFFIIFIILSMVKTCEVHAETRNVSGNTKISGYYVAPGNYWTVQSQNTRMVLLLYEDWTMAMAEEHYNFGYLDICSNIELRVNNNSADCSDGCIDNLALVKLNRSCKIYADNTSYSGIEYYMFYSIRSYKYKNADTLPYFQDYITLENWSNYNGFVQFTQSFLSDEDVYMLYASNGRIEELQEQTNQLIQSQSQTQHQDALNTQNAINDVNDSINDDNVNGASSQLDSLLSNQAFNDNSGIQSIINAPLNFIRGLTTTCTPIQVTIPYINTNLSIPCIKSELNNHIPSVVPILSTAINGFIIYRILIDIVFIIKSSRNPEDDRLEVLDL